MPAKSAAQLFCKTSTILATTLTCFCASCDAGIKLPFEDSEKEHPANLGVLNQKWARSYCGKTVIDKFDCYVVVLARAGRPSVFEINRTLAYRSCPVPSSAGTFAEATDPFSTTRRPQAGYLKGC